MRSYRAAACTEGGGSVSVRAPWNSEIAIPDGKGVAHRFTMHQFAHLPSGTPLPTGEWVSSCGLTMDMEYGTSVKSWQPWVIVDGVHVEHWDGPMCEACACAAVSPLSADTTTPPTTP